MQITNQEKYIMINGTPVIAPELFTLAVTVAKQERWKQAFKAVEIWIEKMVGLPLKMTIEQMEELYEVIVKKGQQRRLELYDEITVCRPGKEPVRGWVYFAGVAPNEVLYISAEGFNPEEDDVDEWIGGPKHQTAQGFIVRGWYEPMKVS